MLNLYEWCEPDFVLLAYYWFAHCVVIALIFNDIKFNTTYRTLERFVIYATRYLALETNELKT